jgi:hypothetical protein
VRDGILAHEEGGEGGFLRLHLRVVRGQAPQGLGLGGQGGGFLLQRVPLGAVV